MDLTVFTDFCQNIACTVLFGCVQAKLPEMFRYMCEPMDDTVKMFVFQHERKLCDVADVMKKGLRFDCPKIPCVLKLVHACQV